LYRIDYNIMVMGIRKAICVTCDDQPGLTQQTFQIGPTSVRYPFLYRSDIGSDIGPMSDVQHRSTSARYGPTDIQPPFIQHCADKIINPIWSNRHSAGIQPTLCRLCTDMIILLIFLNKSTKYLYI